MFFNKKNRGGERKREMKTMFIIYFITLLGLCSQKLVRKYKERCADKNAVNHKKKKDWLTNTLSKCVVKYKSSWTEKITLRRGSGSFITIGKNKKVNKDETMRYCVFTMWAATHVITYMFLGFFCPSLFWLTFIIGTLFEIFECFTFDCHDILDIFYNTIGFGIGYLIQKILI